MGYQVEQPPEEGHLGAQERVSGCLASDTPNLTPFFWVANISMTKLTAWRLLAVAIAAKMMHPQLKAVSLRQNRVLSELDPVYSLGRRRNK